MINAHVSSSDRFLFLFLSTASGGSTSVALACSAAAASAAVSSRIFFILSSKVLFIVFLRFDAGALSCVGEWDRETRGLELSCREAADACLGRFDSFLRAY